MYKEIGHIDSLSEITDLLKGAKWKQVRGEKSHYDTYFPIVHNVDKAFFLKIPPGGKVHKHVDTQRPTETYHIPIQTNDESICYMYEPKKTGYHLEVGKVYWVNRYIPHESVNNGKTDRIHLLLEC